jgi:hypothetical protein
MFLRIIGLVVLMAIMVVGYFFIRDAIRANRLDEYSQYAGVIAETSIAAQLYRNNSDSFLVARDSILMQYDLTMEDVAAFREKMQDNQEDWRIVFDIVGYLADSLVDIRLTKLITIPDSSVDSSIIKE